MKILVFPLVYIVRKFEKEKEDKTMKKAKCENTVKVCLSDGDYIITTIFGSRADVLRYYRVGNVINNGIISDNLVKITGVEILFSDNDFS